MSGTRQPGRNEELITATTATTIGPGDAGKTFTNLGAGGSVTLTFQSAALFRPGDRITVCAAAAQNIICAFTAGQLVTFNNVGATSVALQTSNEVIGGGFVFTCLSAAKWHVLVCCEETQTVTVA